MISLFAEVYAATGKVSGLTLSDVNKPTTAAYLDGIEQAVVHYGTSTGFFNSKMLANGPEYLSAAVLYESNVIESYNSEHDLPFPVVAIYPKEGTFWSDNPYYIIDAPWSSKDQRAAAEVFLNYLLSEPVQRESLKHGFRPGNTDVPIVFGDSPFTLYQKYGLQIEPGSTAEPPKAEVINNLLAIWQRSQGGR